MITRIVTERAEHKIPHAVSCRALGVSESWFYEHRNRPPTRTEQRTDRLDHAVTEVFEAHDGEYGSPRIHAELIERTEWARLSVNTVAQRMQALGLHAKKKRRRRSLTRADKTAPTFPNLLGRRFTTNKPNVAWVGDITEVTTWEGKLYVATVIDLYSRRLIGWAIADHCRAGLVCDALKMAIAARGGSIADVVFHSDRGSQYTSRTFRQLCSKWRITQSMSRTGSCLDNAVAESWFATFKTEMVYRTTLATRRQARRECNIWIDRYNRVRRHSHCGYQSPITFEEAHPNRATKAA